MNGIIDKFYEYRPQVEFEHFLYFGLFSDMVNVWLAPHIIFKY